MIAVVMVSTVGNNEDRASVNSMEKKKNDQSGDTGICKTAVGYVINARADPLVTTSLMSLFSCLAMNPKTEKTQNPAKKEVPQLIKDTNTASL
jgi:hypothetical protein